MTIGFHNQRYQHFHEEARQYYDLPHLQEANFAAD